MKKLIPLLLLIFVSSGFAATHTINSLPYTFNAKSMTPGEVDTLVLGSSKLRSSGSGITLEALYANEIHDVVVNLGNDTISFGEGGGASNYGIRTIGTGSYYPYDIKIVGGHILHNPSNSTANNNRCLSIRGNAILVEDVNAVVRGYNGMVYEAKGPHVYDLEIRGGRFRSEVTGFDSRCDFDAPVIKINHIENGMLTANGATDHLEVNGVVIDGGPHVGILVYAEAGDYGTVKIHDCSIMTDMRNDFYPTYSGICYSAANAYGIFVSAVYPGTEIYNNTITSGTEYGGNRGIYVGVGYGTADNPIRIYGNYVDVHEGPGVEMGDQNPAHGLRIRYRPQYIDVFNNTFICTGDNDPNTTSYGIGVHPVRLSTNSSGTHVTIRNNIIEARSLSSSGVQCNGVTFDGIDYPNTFFLEGNVIRSAGTIYKYGEIGTQSNGPTGVSIVGDTVSFLPNPINPVTYYLGHLSNNWICTQNKACDVVYLGDAAFNDITFSSDTDTPRDILIQETVDLTVIGNNGLVVTGADVTVRNNRGQTFTGVSNNMGKFSRVVNMWYESSSAPDTTNYNNFFIQVAKAGDIWDTTLALGSDAPSLAPLLAQTEGDGGQPNQGPVLSPIGSKTVVAGELLSFSVSASDDYDTPSLTAVPLPTGASFVDHNNGNGTFAWTPSGTQVGTYDITFAALDSEPLQDAEMVRITVNESGSGSDETDPDPVDDLQGATGTGNGNINLAWTSTGDDGSYGTAASYVIKLSYESFTAAGWDAISYTVADPPQPEVAGTPQTMVVSGLEPNALCYVAMRAFDEAGNASAMSNVTSCYASINISTGDESLISAKLIPDDGAVVSAIKPTLSAQNIAIPGQNFYYFDVAADSSFFNTVASSAPIPESNLNFTEWRVDEPLGRNQLYYWRVRVNNYDYSAVYAFSVSSKVYAYPNPVNFNNGQLLSFNLPTKPTDLLIQTVSGETVLLASGVSGSWAWDGLNSSGSQVSVGVYSWFLKGTKYNGKIIVKK